MIEPYVYSNGSDVHGEADPPVPTYGSSQTTPRRASLARRARRAKTDPNWSSHSDRLKQVLLQDDSKGQP